MAVTNRKKELALSRARRHHACCRGCADIRQEGRRPERARAAASAAGAAGCDRVRRTGDAARSAGGACRRGTLETSRAGGCRGSLARRGTGRPAGSLARRAAGEVKAACPSVRAGVFLGSRWLGIHAVKRRPLISVACRCTQAGRFAQHQNGKIPRGTYDATGIKWGGSCCVLLLALRCESRGAILLLYLVSLFGLQQSGIPGRWWGAEFRS
jgi:hypothetical protein